MGKNFLLIIMFGTLTLNLIGKSSERPLKLMIRSLQIILHLSIFQVVIPQSAMVFISTVMSIAMFDITASFIDWQS